MMIVANQSELLLLLLLLLLLNNPLRRYILLEYTACNLGEIYRRFGAA